MANKISTVRTYPLTGSVKDFTVTFEYLARKFIQVTLIGKDRKELVLNQDYRFTSKNQITTTRVWSAADGYQSIEIRRFTSATERLVDFADGSILRAYDLNISQIQTLHVAEEARDLTADTIGINNDGHLDARGRKIVNLAYATGDFDAVPFKQIKEREQSAWNAVAKATQEADRATAQATRSESWADNSKTHASESGRQSGISTSEANRSKGEADRATNEANRSKGYADGMVQSVADAKAWSLRSTQEADRAKGEADRAAGEVTKAAAQVTLAAGHVASAKTQADRATVEANRSRAEADRAKLEADKLGNMNQFAGTIDKVEALTVFFKGNLVANGGNMTATSNNPRFVLDSALSGNGGSTAVVGSQEGSNDWFVGRASTGSRDVSLHSYQHNIGLYLRADGVHTNRDIWVDNSKSSFRKETDKGGWSGWNTVGYFDVQHDIATKGDMVYYLERASIWGTEHLYAKMLYNNGTGQQFLIRQQLRGVSFDTLSDGEMRCSTGWRITPDGNLWMPKFARYIDDWVNYQVANHGYSFAESDNRYSRRDAGWMTGYVGNIDAGGSVNMLTTGRWRTIFLRIDGRWYPVTLGDIGAYTLSTENGFVKFSIGGSNGIVFTVNAHKNSVITQIMVKAE